MKDDHQSGTRKPENYKYPDCVRPEPATKTKPPGYRVQKFVLDQHGNRRKKSKTFRGRDAFDKAVAYAEKIERQKIEGYGNAPRAFVYHPDSRDDGLVREQHKEINRLKKRLEQPEELSGQTFTEFIEETFLADGAKNYSQKSAVWSIVQKYGEESGCQIHLLHLQQIKPSMINQFVTWMEQTTNKNGKRYSKASIDRYQKMLRSMITHWSNDERAEFNPAAPENLNIVPSHIKGRKKKQKVRTQEELDLFEQEAEQTINERKGQYEGTRTMFLHFHKVLRWTGQRPGEIGRLKKESLNLEKSICLIEDTKTGNDRVIPLLSEAKKAIETWLEIRTALGFPDDELVFSKEDGSEVTKSQYRGHYRRISDNAEIDPAITAYQLRHSLNDYIRRMGVPVEIRNALLGHLTEEINLNYTDISAVEVLDYLEEE